MELACGDPGVTLVLRHERLALCLFDWPLASNAVLCCAAGPTSSSHCRQPVIAIPMLLVA